MILNALANVIVPLVLSSPLAIALLFLLGIQ